MATTWWTTCESNASSEAGYSGRRSVRSEKILEKIDSPRPLDRCARGTRYVAMRMHYAVVLHDSAFILQRFKSSGFFNCHTNIAIHKPFLSSLKASYVLYLGLPYCLLNTSSVYFLYFYSNAFICQGGKWCSTKEVIYRPVLHVCGSVIAGSLVLPQ